MSNNLYHLTTAAALTITLLSGLYVLAEHIFTARAIINHCQHQTASTFVLTSTKPVVLSPLS